MFYTETYCADLFSYALQERPGEVESVVDLINLLLLARLDPEGSTAKEIRRFYVSDNYARDIGGTLAWLIASCNGNPHRPLRDVVGGIEL